MSFESRSLSEMTVGSVSPFVTPRLAIRPNVIVGAYLNIGHLRTII